MYNFYHRKFYEYDNAFYKNKANINCWEQMLYQSLRSYDLDYFLVFCDDICVQLDLENEENIILNTSYLKFNKKLFKYVNVTSDWLVAENKIISVLEEGFVVIFQTAMDSLRTCIWFKENEPYTKTTHNAILVGYDDKYFFYVDSPPMRNPLYFVAHKDNPAVGLIERSELIHSFHFFCNIGYIKINELELKNIADINRILAAIAQNYYCELIEEHKLKGRSALLKLIEILEGNENTNVILEDSFAVHLIASRHKKLKMCIIKYRKSIIGLPVEEIVDLLSSLTDRWSNIEMLIIKYRLKPELIIPKKIAKLIEKEVLPLTDQFIAKIGL